MSKFNVDYTGTTVIITGVAGLTLTQAFYANNANVVITDVNNDCLSSHVGGPLASTLLSSRSFAIEIPENRTWES
jgi:hypothetical protein